MIIYERLSQQRQTRKALIILPYVGKCRQELQGTAVSQLERDYLIDFSCVKQLNCEFVFETTFCAFLTLKPREHAVFLVIWTTMLELLRCISFSCVDNSNVSSFYLFLSGQNPPPVRGFGERARAPSASK